MSLTTILLGKSRQKKIQFFLPFIRDREVLDIGCAGEGEKPYNRDTWVHRDIVSNSSYCLGIDHNEKIVNELRSLGYNVMLGDAQELPVDRRFDVVCAFDVIEHIADLESFFDGVNKLLKEKGQLLVSVPNPWFFLRFIRCLIKGHGGVNPDHVHWFCTATIEELLKRYKFQVNELEYGSGEPRLYFLYFFPPVLRHTSVYVVATKSDCKSVVSG